MRWVVVVSVGVLAGCATTAPTPRISAHRPHHAVPLATAKPTPPASTPVKLEAPTPPPEGPGSNVPLEGFRPMRNQSRSGA